jgi:hypothetical protein
MPMSALRIVSWALSISVWKNGQPACMALRRSLAFGPRRSIDSSALPRPNQPGKLKRLCIQEKTQGMALRSATLCVALR